MQVTVLAIEHEHGTNITVHASELGAMTVLYEFVEKYWDTMENPDTPSGDMKEDIATYFDYYELTESFIMQTTELQP